VPRMPHLPGQRRQSMWTAVAWIGFVIAVGAVAYAIWTLTVLYFRQPQSKQDELTGVVSMFTEIASFLFGVLVLIVGRTKLGSIGQIRESDQQQSASVSGNLRRGVPRVVPKRLPQIEDRPALALGVHRAIPLRKTPRIERPSSMFEILLFRLSLLRSRSRIRGNFGTDPLSVTDAPHPDLPTFVERDTGPEIRHWMNAARRTGGFLLLVGEPSVGKTRLLYEAARRELPDFAVLAPSPGDGDLVNLVADSRRRFPSLIVWLDELQRFLPGPYQTPNSTSITSSTVRSLLDSQVPVVLLSTMLTNYLRVLCTTDPDPLVGGARAQYPEAYDILSDPRLHEIVIQRFSANECRDALKLANQDPRLAEALAIADFSVTEALAGVPQLVQRWTRASDDEKAVMYVMIDARRLGVQMPLSESLLAAATRGYLTTLHPDDEWVPSVLTRLTNPERTVAPVRIVHDAQRRMIVGYAVVGYLLQLAQAERRNSRVPPEVWQALMSHVGDQDASRLADSAKDRLLYCYAIPLYRRQADNGDSMAAARLADVLLKQRKIDDALDLLRARADGGDVAAAEQLAGLLASRDEVEELRARADGGDVAAAEQLAGLLASRDEVEELRARADGGDVAAAEQLAGLLASRDEVEELRARADGGDVAAAEQLVGLLIKRADQLDEHDRSDEATSLIDEALAVLRAQAYADDTVAGRRLADLLLSSGRFDEAIEILRVSAAAGDRAAVHRLADLLAQLGRMDEATQTLKTLAAAGDRAAVHRLADLLAQLGRMDEATQTLKTLAAEGDRAAVHRLADLLAQLGRMDEATQTLKTLAAEGDSTAVHRVADFLIAQQSTKEAASVLRTQADAGDTSAAHRLANLLADLEGVDELRARADAGDPAAAYRLADILVDNGKVNEAVMLVRRQVDAGEKTAGEQLTGLLERIGRIQDAELIRRFGFNPDGSIASYSYAG
jgi:predicted negative regulator of RcsB-dependent stress response